MKKPKKVVWFAKGGGIAKCGPFKSQIEATNAMKLVKHPPCDYREFPDDVFVWPEKM